MLERYYRELLNYFARQLKDRDGAADVVQEAYARVLTVQQAGQSIREPRALLYRTARNIVIDQQRHQAVSDADGQAALDELAAPAIQQPEQAYAAHQRASRLVDVIEALPLAAGKPSCSTSSKACRMPRWPSAWASRATWSNAM